MSEEIARIGDVELAYETFGDHADPAVLLVMWLGTQMLGWRAGFWIAGLAGILVALAVFALVPNQPAEHKDDSSALSQMIEVLRRSLVDTRARQGCESVTVHTDHDRPNVVLLVERCATREDDDAYRAWRAGDGAVKEMAGLVARMGRQRAVRRLEAAARR